MERQGFGIRLGAFLIDFVFLLIINIIIGLIFGLGFGIRYGSAAAQAGIGYTLVSTLVMLGYWSTEIFNAASPGKKLLGLKIGAETGAPATQNELVIRYLAKNSPNLVGLLGILPAIGFIFGLLSVGLALAFLVGCFLTLGQNRQALHDMLAHTAVYKLVPVSAGFPVMPMPPGTMPPPPPPTA
jgi:uncharacterized RDD family membrane protein YckC